MIARRTLLSLAAWIVATIVASPSTVLAAPRGVLRFAVLHSSELLPSEARAVSELKRKLERAWQGAVRADEPTANEAAALRELADGKKPGSLTEWQSTERVLLLEVVPPRVEKGKRITRGMGAIALLRPSDGATLYSERVEGAAEVWLQGPTFGDWLARLAQLGATR